MLGILPNAQDVSPTIVDDDVQSLIVFLHALEAHRFRSREITTSRTLVLMTAGCADS
jgi:hypothetical protein